MVAIIRHGMAIHRPLLQLVEAALRKHDIAPSVFGRRAVNDPHFVFSLRCGREPRPATERRVRAYLQQMEVSRGS